MKTALILFKFVAIGIFVLVAAFNALPMETKRAMLVTAIFAAVVLAALLYRPAPSPPRLAHDLIIFPLRRSYKWEEPQQPLPPLAVRVQVKGRQEALDERLQEPYFQGLLRAVYDGYDWASDEGDGLTDDGRLALAVLAIDLSA